MSDDNPLAAVPVPHFHGLDPLEPSERVLERIEKVIERLRYPRDMVAVGTHAYAEVLSQALRAQFPGITPNPNEYLAGRGITVVWIPPGVTGMATGSGFKPGATVEVAPSVGLIVWPAS